MKVIILSLYKISTNKISTNKQQLYFYLLYKSINLLLNKSILKWCC